MNDQSTTKFEPMTPAELAAELGVPLTERRQPDLSAAVPKRWVTREEAKARKLSWFFDATGGTCRYGHTAARRTSNPNICSDCDRVKAGEEPIYGKSRTQKYYDEPRRKPKDPSAPTVIAATAAPPAPPEPTKKEQEFLAALDETRNFDAAAQRTNFSRSQIEARASVNEVFRKALTDLCERRGIAWTRAPDAIGFEWTPEIEKQFAARFIDTGLLAQVRDEMGITASAYHERLQSSSTFTSLMAAAEPLARLTLRDRATQAASVGRVDLLKYLEGQSEEDSLGDMSPEQMNAEIQRLLKSFESMGLFPRERQHKDTGKIINLDDYEYVQYDSSNLDLVQP